MLTLYAAPRTRSLSVLWLLEEIGVPYTLKRLDLDKAEHKSEAFLKLNPLGKVPTLVDDGTPLTERAAICTYLADKYAGGKLAPGIMELQRGEYLRWMFFSVGVMEVLFTAKFLSLDLPASQAPYGTFDEANALMDAAVAKGPYLLGDQFTAADVMMGTMIRWGLMWELVAGPHLESYVKTLEARPGLQRALKLEAEAAGAT
jgi:glutathione S-transferase